MSRFFLYRQNNSGGSFDAPAVNVIVEASTKDSANELFGRHLTLCGDSGLYAEYDNCGCCPCCGHRWSEPWSDQPEDGAALYESAAFGTNWGVPRIALIRATGDMVVSDTDERMAEIKATLIGKADQP